MAYYDDGYIWPQDQHPTYDLLYHQDSVSFSGSYEVDTYDAYTVSESYEPKFIDHYNQPQDYIYDYGHNSYSSASPDISYFAYNYVEPKLITYEPVACDTGYISYHTNYSISYPTQPMDSGFNEPEFVEYDPTPYGGGYDIVSVYGKPLPPSDKTCYPRSNPNPIQPTPKFNPEPESKPMAIPVVDPKPEPVPILIPLVEPEPANNVPVPIPLIEPEPANNVPVPIPLIEPEPAHVPVPMPEPESVHVPVTMGEPLESKEYSYPDYGYDYPWPEYDHGYGIGVGYDHGYNGKQVVQIPPYEYNPEVVDLCENIFGSWPCLTRIRKQQMGVDNNQGITYPEKGHHNPWEDCANYFFRGPVRASYDQ